MDEKKGLLGYYNYTVILTYIGMLFGFTGIVCAIDNSFHNSILCLMFAGLCDMFDGAVASTRKRDANEKCFGIQIDSLSDLICFGVLPGLLIYCINGKTDLAFMLSGVYVLCALIRLSYFNVDEMNRQAKTDGAREYYFGMPVTLSAMIVPAYYEICSSFDLPIKTPGLVILFMMAAAFLVPFRLKKPKIIGKICFMLIGLGELFLLVLGVDM